MAHHAVASRGRVRRSGFDETRRVILGARGGIGWPCIPALSTQLYQSPIAAKQASPGPSGRAKRQPIVLLWSTLPFLNNPDIVSPGTDLAFRSDVLLRLPALRQQPPLTVRAQADVLQTRLRLGVPLEVADMLQEYRHSRALVAPVWIVEKPARQLGRPIG